MCGIVGAVGGTEPNIRAALELIKSRGPDDTSVSVLDGIILGHNRLSIIDLAEVANQPMTSSCGRYVIIFNGEIYNYQEIRDSIGREYLWKTHSDTEVMLAAYKKWGTACLEKFRGMFAFSIWDIQEKKLFAARDRLGVKPFYYREVNGEFYFGSRPDAVVKASGRNDVTLNPQAIRLFLESGYVPAPFSIYRELKKLEPGHFLEFQNAKLRIEKYWSLDAVATDNSARSEGELLQELEALVQDSVRLRMVSDVPIGVFLSGGIDSSLVAAMMAKLSPSAVKSFSIGFSDREFDESTHAEAVSMHLKTEHHFERFDGDDLLEFIPTFIKQYDEPFFDYSAFPVMAVSKMARQNVKVSLSGDGGDEAFGGYHYYRLLQQYEWIQKIPYVVRCALGVAFEMLPFHKLRLLGGLMKTRGTAEAFAFLRSVIKSNKNIFSKEILQNTFGLSELFAKKVSGLPQSLAPAETGMRLDIAYTLPDDYLQKVDVGSMAFSLEARDPLLDHRLFEWAAALPLKWKIRGTNKYLLRQLAYKYVPREILDRPKMGFGVPMAKWLRGPLKSWAEPLIQDSEGLLKLGLVPSEVQKIWKDHQENRVQAHTILWSILVLQSFQSERPWL